MANENGAGRPAKQTVALTIFVEPHVLENVDIKKLKTHLRFECVKFGAVAPPEASAGTKQSVFELLQKLALLTSRSYTDRMLVAISKNNIYDIAKLVVKGRKFISLDVDRLLSQLMTVVKWD